MRTLLMNSIGLGLCATLFVINAFAQEVPGGPLLHTTELTIKPGQYMAFREGVKVWKACYLEKQGELKWRLWQQHQGEGSVFMYTSSKANWAEMDKQDEVWNQCWQLFQAMVLPHVEKDISHVSRFVPEVSNDQPFEAEVIRISFYKLNPINGYKLMESVKEVKAIREKAGLQHPGYWYRWLSAGPDSPDYHVVISYKDYADMDIVRSTVYEMIEKEMGMEKRDELRLTIGSALDNSWGYTYKLDKEISWTGSDLELRELSIK